ncbi:hypothetical protein Vretifemale_18644 [Volvox reticuliferus]|uniref:Uncharacterized protein n=1 Tax=Volvox reticuliferus TaxID=1737510 RepID=A0A8J4CZY0_9CHLO|nr:hypothetical protein Vretifemale_18644 [Volvox reticuliferus]
MQLLYALQLGLLANVWLLLEDLLLLWLQHLDHIGQWSARATLAGRVPVLHDLDLNAQHALAQKNVANSGIDVDLGWVAAANHVSVLELHALGTSSPQLAGDNNLAALGAALHHEAQHAIARPADG